MSLLDRCDNQPPQVRALAAKAYAFSSVFSEPTGLSPIYYFIRLRVQYARQVLESGMASVKDIAAALGYDARFIFDACLHQSLRSRPAVRERRNLPG